MEDQDERIDDKAGVLVCFLTSLPFSLSCIPSWLFSSDCMKHCSVFEFIVPKKLVPLSVLAIEVRMAIHLCWFWNPASFICLLPSRALYGFMIVYGGYNC